MTYTNTQIAYSSYNYDIHYVTFILAIYTYNHKSGHKGGFSISQQLWLKKARCKKRAKIFFLVN